MTSGKPAKIVGDENHIQQRLKVHEHPPLHPSNMKLDEKSVALLTTIKRQFPLFMPQKVRLRILDKISMHAAVVARARGATCISVDDLLIAMYQSLPSGLVDAICSRLKITQEQRTEYQQKAFNMDYVSMDDFLRDLKIHAQKCGAEINEGKLLPVLNCYKHIVEGSSLYIKTTTKDVNPRELFVRPGHSARWFGLAGMAKAHHLVNLSDHPAYQAYASVCSKVDAIGSMVDISVEGDIQKFYAFFVHKPEPISRIRKCKNLPPSLFANCSLLESWGFKRFSMFGVDFKNNSSNFYYYTEQTEFTRAKIETILTSLGFPLPAEEMLEQMEGAALVYFTFTHASDQIERVCFTRVYENDMESVVKLAPAFRDFIEEAPVKSATRNLLLGFAFSKKGHYLKLELDYKASVQIPKMMKYTGLYSNPDEF